MMTKELEALEMLKIHCCMCEEELQRPGGLIISPPQTKHQYVEKGHLCFECYWRVLFFINGKKGEDETEKAKAVREALIEAKFNVKNKVLRYCSKSQQEPMGEAITHAIHQILLEEEKHG